MSSDIPVAQPTIAQHGQGDGGEHVAPFVVPMEITYMDTEHEYKKYGTLSPLRYIYSNPFRFLISSLGLPNIPSQEG
jgi:hypothetical protein